MELYYPQDRLPFGKCKGETLQDIYHFNPGYIEWLIKYKDEFSVNINDFKGLPTPTPYIVEKKAEGSNLLWIQERANTVEAAKAFVSIGGVISKKEFQFSEKIIQILKQKENGIYKAPSYKYLSDENDLYVP